MSILIEYKKAPIAINTRKPSFSWDLPLSGRNRKQTAYRILIASSVDLLEPDLADTWDSGKVDSSKSVNIVYAGKELKNNKTYHIKVTIWDESGNQIGPGEISCFGTGLLDESAWQAEWIGMGPEQEPVFDPYSLSQEDGSSGLQLAEDDLKKLPSELYNLKQDLRSPMLRRSFEIPCSVKRARAFVCGLGLFELRLNGHKVGEDVLTTPRTDFSKRIYYFTYDITSELTSGENVIGIILGNGWFNGQKKYWHWQSPWFGHPRALLQLEIEYEDYTTEIITSNETWRGEFSPITLNCIYDGEDYDARLEKTGWDEKGYDDTDWSPVNLVSAPGGKLSSLDHQPNKIMESFKAVSISQPEPGVFVFDMGKVMTGWVSLVIPKGIKGQSVKLRYAELKHQNGMIDCRTAGNARQTDIYTMKGGKDESYEPRFTYHGFRYVELTGFPGKPDLETLKASFVYNGVDQIGSFKCADDLINKIHSCTLQSQRCNLQMGVPTDDTQREERLGWCGDAWSYAHESFYNFDTANFWNKWIADFYDQQDEYGLVGYINPLPGFGEDLVWSAAFVLIPWWHYIHYGDRRILERSYPYLKKYINYLERVGQKDIPPLAADKVGKVLFPKCSHESRFCSQENHGYLQRSLFGDHLATHEGSSGFCKDHPRSMATAFYYHDVMTMVKIAETMGENIDVKHYQNLAAKIKKSYNDYFFDERLGYYDIGCQSAQALALAFDLVPEQYRQKVQSYLNSSVNFRQRRITSGYAATKWVIKAIAQSGRNEIIWKRATASDYPSWGYMLHDDKTTITENWHGGGSQCHTTLGAAVDEWFYWGLAGIRPDVSAPGFERIIFKPYLPENLPWAKASIHTVRGIIISEWEQDEKTASLEIGIPANSNAEVYIPSSKVENITEGNKKASESEGVNLLRVSDSEVVFAVGSGNYIFKWNKT